MKSKAKSATGMGKRPERSNVWVTCPKCGGAMKIISFMTEYAVVDRIIDHLQVTSVAERPPPAHLACQEVLMAAETSAEYFHDLHFD